jgi:UDP-N-acetylglucosamine acyltransferase
MTAIHPTAIVDSQARLHAGVTVGPYSIVGPDVEIGEGTKVGPHVVLKGPMTIGRNNTIFQFASLGEVAQDKSVKDSDATRVQIGDGNMIREYVTINRGTLKEEGVTTVGDDNWIMAGSHIAHDCKVGSHAILANCVLLAGHVRIEDWAILGGFTGVHQFCRVGAHAFCGGGSVVLRDVLPFVMVQGNPAEARAVNTEGLRRRGFSADDIGAIRDAYKLIYVSGRPMAEIKAGLAEQAKGSDHVRRMLESLETSKRSIAR